MVCLLQILQKRIDLSVAEGDEQKKTFENSVFFYFLDKGIEGNCNETCFILAKLMGGDDRLGYLCEFMCDLVGFEIYYFSLQM